MSTTLKDKIARLDADRRARIEEEAQQLHSEYLTLRELRKAKELTQVELAETLGMKQASVAQMEQRGDLMLSTVRGYVEAMGGKLRLLVEFPDRESVSLDGLGDTEEPRARRRGHDHRARSA